MAVKVSDLDRAVAQRLGISDPANVTQADRDKLIRKLLASRGKVPVICDRKEIVPAPARGPVLTFYPREAVITDAGNVRSQRAGRYAAMKVQDAFDKADVQAARRKQPAPFTPGQRDVGREYAELFTRCQASGLKLSQMNGSGGGGGTAGVSEAVLADMQRLAWMQRQIGQGVAMAVRRVRPSQRGGDGSRRARNITDANLVRSFCVDAETLSAVLVAHGWSGRGENKKALHRALCAALDRVRGFYDRV